MGALTVTTSAMAMSVAMHGGKTFQTDMFCKGKDGVGGGCDPAGQCPRHPVSEVAGRMPGQMAEQVAAQVAGDRNKGVAGDPARAAPEQIVCGNQRRQ